MNELVREKLQGFPIVVPNQVDWADMDILRHVNNTVYFRYFENARIQFLGAIGFGDENGVDGLGPILHSTSARFRRPLRFPDTAWTGARALDVHDDRFSMEYRLVSDRDQEVAAEGTALVVCYDYRALRKAALPQSVREGITRLQG